MTPAEQIAERLARVWDAEFAGSIWEWADGMDMPQSTLTGGTFQPHRSPWLLQPLEDLTDPRVREVVVIAPAGSAKSMLAELLIAWTVKHDPGRLYYVCQSDTDAQDAMEGRVMPFLAANNARGIVLPMDRSKKRATKVMFPTMELYAMGPGINNAQSKRVKILIMDETHTYDEGMLSAFRKRHTGVAAPKTLIVSTGSETDDQTDESFKAGHMAEYQVQCPECHRFQAMRNARMRYETSERTVDAEGNYRMEAVRQSVTYQCDNRECEAHWKGDPGTRAKILEGGHYVATNPNAPESKRSYHYPAHIVPWILWEDLAEEWIKANRAASVGVLEPRKDYIQKQLAEPWDASPREEDHIKTGARTGAYIKRQEWSEELTRFVSSDQQGRANAQGGIFYAVCKAYAADGQSRTVDAAVLQTFEQLEEFRQDNKTEPRRTGLDVAFNNAVSIQRCAQYGWTGLWGDDRRHWAHDARSIWHPRNLAKAAGKPRREWEAIPDKPIMLPFSNRNIAQGGLGLAGKTQLVPYFYWSNPWVKDIWHHLHNGLGANFTHASDIGKLYVSQTQTEIKSLTYNKSTGRRIWTWIVPSKKSADEMKQDHYLDADQMNLAMALMDPRIALSAAILGGEDVATPEEIAELEIA